MNVWRRRKIFHVIPQVDNTVGQKYMKSKYAELVLAAQSIFDDVQMLYSIHSNVILEGIKETNSHSSSWHIYKRTPWSKISNFRKFSIKTGLLDNIFLATRELDWWASKISSPLLILEACWLKYEVSSAIDDIVSHYNNEQFNLVRKNGHEIKMAVDLGRYQTETICANGKIGVLLDERV